MTALAQVGSRRGAAQRAKYAMKLGVAAKPCREGGGEQVFAAGVEQHLEALEAQAQARIPEFSQPLP